MLLAARNRGLNHKGFLVHEKPVAAGSGWSGCLITPLGIEALSLQSAMFPVLAG